MSDVSKIEWTDSTFNPWIGCTKVSPACDHCYAENMMDTRLGRVQWGAGKPRSRTSAEYWRQPIRWNAMEVRVVRGVPMESTGTSEYWNGQVYAVHTRALGPKATAQRLDISPEEWAAAPRWRRRVFCASLADVFDNEVPAEWLVDLLDLIRRTPNLDWLLLTKRIGNVSKRLSSVVDALDRGLRGSEPMGDLCDWIEYWLGGGAVPKNVWIGATICNQPEADRDIPKLLATPAAVRFVSIEPMLSDIDITEHLWGRAQPCAECPQDADCHCGFSARRELAGEPALDWVIAGGESGPHARPSHPEWFRSLRDQCAAAGVPFLFKQWGEYAEASMSNIDAGADRFVEHDGTDSTHWTIDRHSESTAHMVRVGKKAAGRLLDGVTHDGFPA